MVLGLAALFACKAVFALSDKANVLFIIWDDWRDDKYNKSSVTPTVEDLRKESFEFSNAFTAFPQCGPSRMSIMTGMHVHKHKTTVADFVGYGGSKMGITGEPIQFSNAFESIPHYFKEQGWRIGIAGKIYHFPTNYFSPQSQLWFTYSDFNNTEIPPPTPDRFPFSNCPIGSKTKVCTCNDIADGKQGSCRDRHTAENIKQWIREERDNSEPWFLLAGFIRPHLDFEVPKEFVGSIKQSDVTTRREGNRNDMALINTLDQFTDSEIFQSPSSFATSMQSYATNIRYVDSLTNEILQTLKETGQYDNTIVVLTSDHGMTLGDRMDHFTKSTILEESLRVPLIIKPALGISLGKKIVWVVESVDLFPTLIDMACPTCAKSTNSDGESLVSLMGNATTRIKDYAISVMQTCESNASTRMRKSSCSLETDNGADANGLVFSYRNAEYRYTEWMKTNPSTEKCHKINKTKACRRRNGCRFQQFITEPKLSDNTRFFCMADVTTKEAIVDQPYLKELFRAKDNFLIDSYSVVSTVSLARANWRTYYS